MDFKQHKAIYLQIADYLCDQILDGVYAEGDKLPSVRELAVDSEVNVNTTTRTLDYLQQNDIAAKRRGLGYYVQTGAKDAISDVRRKEFFEETLPEVFRTMDVLGISADEVTEFYNMQKNDQT